MISTTAWSLLLLLEMVISSPVYNMQPAFITANIGTGRNIRNLPCVSRKTNQSGVCMFAIDCLKANGTHLGTCIDRFYFGSCCHIQPVHDITENTIDTDIIPAREPPQRLSTLRPTTPEHNITTLVNTLHNITTAQEPIPTTTKPSTTTQPPIVTKQSLTTKPTTTSTTSTTTTTSTTPLTTTTTTTTTTTPPSTTTTRTTTTTPTTKTTTTTPFPEKLQTFQSVEAVTIQPTTTTTTTIKPKPTTKPTRRPVKPQKPLKPITKPPRTTTKPTRITTKTTQKPKTTTTRTTTKPSSAKPAQKPQKTPIPVKPVKVTSPKPVSTTITTTTTTKPSTTRRKPVTTTKPIRKTAATTTTTTTTTPQTTTVLSTIKPTTTTEETTILITTAESIKQNISQPGAVSGNTATNEIEESPELVTTTHKATIPWTVADSKHNLTQTATEPEDWVPVTTPDSWVLLPSVSPVTGKPQDSTSIPVENNKPVEVTTTTTATTSKPTVKPTITYIPLITSNDVEVSSTTSQIPPLPSNGTTTSRPLPEKVESSTTPIPSTPKPNLDSSPVNMSDFTDVCGRRMFPEARIVGGEKSSFGRWPWQISLRQWRTSTYLHKCGAALLNENWAITAAHCVDNVPPSDLLLRLGEHDLSTESEPYLHQERRVQIVASHPQFDPRTFEYDLALLRFYEPVTFQPNILPVCVPQTDENFVGRTAYVTGWGRLYEDGPLPSVLQEVSVPVINNSVCESMYRSAGYIEHIPHIFICAGWRRGGFDSCEGDSGGPMVIQREDKRFLLAGVISWGIGCAEPNQPGVYTRISEFRDWINQILQF